MTLIEGPALRSPKGPAPRSSKGREWRQIRLLSRDSVRRLLDTALFSSDTDPAQFAIWGLAILVTPPFLFAVRSTMSFPFLRLTPAAVVEQVALGQRLFFIIYGMLTSALLAALTWEALFPNRMDQEILGTLPVRPRSLALARLGAAAAVAAVFSAGVSIPAALIYGLGSATHPVIGPLPLVILAHFTAVMLGCLFVFFTLMSVRGLVAICAGERIAERLATGLQIVTISLLVEVFLFLPSLLPRLVRDLQAGDRFVTSLPPLWFGALYSVIAEGGPSLVQPALMALLSTFASAAFVVVISLAPARMMGRRALDTRSVERGQGTVRAARVVAALLIRRADVRAVFLFAIASLASSRRHRIILSTYLGMAIAAATLSVATSMLRGTLSLAAPAPFLLAIPLVFIFLVVFGLRACFIVPTIGDANWPFKLSPPTVAASRSAARLVILLLGVAPTVSAAALAAATLWSVEVALYVAVFDIAAAAGLIDLALLRWQSIPFATAHAPHTDTVKSRWVTYAVGLGFYATTLSNIQYGLLDHPRGTVMYVLIAVAIVGALRLLQWILARDKSVIFEEPWDGPETLNLSAALD